MPTKRGPERGQIEEYVKRIARRLVARRKQRNSNGSRDYQETAHKQKRVVTHGCTVEEIGGRKLAREWIYWDTGNLLSQA